jgi:PAS domain S-box-containing protein
MPTRQNPTNDELLNENGQLRLRLEEAEAIVEAIRNGLVDAVFVNAPPGEGVYTLEGAERPYRRMVEAIRQGVAVLNREGVVLYCNPCLADLLVMSVEKLTGCAIDSFVAENDIDIWAEILKDSGATSASREVFIRRQNGSNFPALLTLSVLSTNNLCLLVTDLSQQKLYEELIASKAKLRNSEIRYRRLFETAKDGILILDTLTGRITDANPFMSELLGYPLEFFSGKELWEIGLFVDRSDNEAAVNELRECGYIRFEHLPLETSTGLRVEVEIVANSYHEEDHSVIQCNIRDMTERSQLEKERDHLENTMREQAAALEDLHRRKDEFLAMLSHELRNPLSPIASALQLLGRQKNEDKLQHQARIVIERQVGQLTRLIDDLLEVSRITTGTIHLQQALIVMNGVIENAVETVRPLLDQRQHELTVSLSLNPIWIFADAARIEQVVVNLLTNAAKFTDKGGHVWLTVEQEGDECAIRVRDTGVGIAPELLPRVFDLFTQAERSLDRSQGGLGIGLALVQRLVEMHRGRVDVSSIVGHGTEFTVRLPVIQDLESIPSNDQVEPAEPDQPSLRILIVDDNVDAAQMLGMLLSESGHDILTLHDGPSVLKTALEYHPHLILLDIGLPGMDGYEVARRLRQQEVFKSVILIAMTGYGNDSDVKRSQDAGFDHHLVKPLNFDKLKEILSNAVGKTT